MRKPATLTDLLTSHEYNDVTGVVTTNVCDALFAIANAINRLAVEQARNTQLLEQIESVRVDRANELREALLAKLAEDAPGHA